MLAEGVDEETWCPTIATAVVLVSALVEVATVAVEVAEALTTVLEMIEPATVTVTGTLTVAVMVAGFALALVAVLAALEQESCWILHSSIVNPFPEMPIQALNW